ncbi:glycerol-3-phosphate acyltransferase [Oscillibacter sp.]|uniref:glycerol-3-phosphate acyltransferase n=1 Tax=Oscillibacter sp. TaxID=1945593 RepID=UPI0028AECBDE|nr:glycerol-3-phosphate acyltransferase [Oscillibacter sp.]
MEASGSIYQFSLLPAIGLGALTALAAYLLGCFNGAVIVSKYILKDDIRTHGSGNAGLTNFYRTFGGALTFVVILTDVLKAVFAVLIGMAVFGHFMGEPAFGKLFAGLFCMIGHMFPCMFHFKGGKGVLSGGIVAIMLDWRVALIVWGGFVLLASLTRFVSLGSVFAGAALPFATYFVMHSPVLAFLAACCGALLIWGHRANIRRLLRGEESKFSFHRKQ